MATALRCLSTPGVSARVAQKALYALRCLLHQRGLDPRAMDAQRAAACEAGAVQLVLAALRANAGGGSGTLQADALLCLSYLVTGTGRRSKEEAGQAGAVPTVLATLRSALASADSSEKHEEATHVVAAGVKALADLVYRSSKNLRRLRDAGGAATVAEAARALAARGCDGDGSMAQGMAALLLQMLSDGAMLPDYEDDGGGRRTPAQQPE